MLRYTPGRFLPLAGSDSRTDCEAVRKSFLHSFYTLSTGLTNGVGIFAHCNGVASGLRALDGGWADCAYGHPVRTFTGLPFYAKDFLQLCQIRAESETICTTFRTVGSDTFSNPHGLQGHSTRPHAAVACLPCVFYIVSHLSDFVKHFFRFVGSGTFYIQSSIPYGSQYRTLCPRHRLGSFDRTRIVSHFRQFVKREFFIPLCLTFTRWKDLLFGFLLQSALCAPVSATSARVALVALTVGLMALCICPGFPRWTFIGSPV